MADTADVENAIVALIARALYPDGTTPLLGVPAKAYRGWPVPAQLDADLKAGTLNASVFPTDAESKVTRHQPRWAELPAASPTLALTAAEATVTVSGTPASPLNAAVVVGNKAYVYAVQPGDTVNAVALGLALLISVDRPATNLGPVLTVPNAASLAARVGGFGSAVRELKRQKRGYQVTLWCPTPQSRDAAASLIDAALAAADYLSLPDGTAARLLYERSRVSDRAERDGLYRRDLFYSAEFSTTQSLTAARVVAEALAVTTEPKDSPCEP